ncbi:MAG: dual specificity protein phosphatase family protein [Solirubrobacterales bacterium]|nr:dual specificity protein phosphatase family protein [Solirubrobacterales bacterium]
MSQWFQDYGFAVVHPRLYVGAMPRDAHDVHQLVAVGVNRVLNLAQDSEYPDGARVEIEISYEVNEISERRINLVDFGNLPGPALGEAVSQVIDWLDAQHTVYLHCRAGWQRSATVAAGVIALREGGGIDHALAVLRARKPTASPLPHQRDDLRRWWSER